jgi:hypothetical protein
MGGFLVGRNVTVYDCARHDFICTRAAWLVIAGLATFALGLSAGPAVRAAGDDAAYHFAGTVVDPQGKPVAGAKVWFDYTLARLPSQSTAHAASSDAVSDAEGKFQFSRTKSSLADMLDVPYGTMGVLMATKEGFGFAAGSAKRFETTGRLKVDRPRLFSSGIGWAKREEPKQDSVLRLVLDDVPLRGELVDTDGRPIADATVEVTAVSEGENGTLDAWETALKKEPSWQHTSILFWRYAAADRMLYVSGPWRRMRRFGPGTTLWDVRAEPVTRVRSDRAGRFTLQGIGRERLVELLIRAAGHETALKFVRTRAGGTLEMRTNRAERTLDEIAPSKFTFKLGPSAPIQGRIVDSGTGKPLAEVRLHSEGYLVPQAVTDANGRYRLEGFPLGELALEVAPPSGTRDFPVVLNVSTDRAERALIRDIEFPAGVLVRGRAIDERTGKPVQGTLGYFAFETNRALLRLKERNFDGSRLGRTDADGRFTIPALPGPGILGLSAGPEFRFGAGAEQIDCPTYGDGRGDRGRKTFRTVPACTADQLNLLVPLNPPPDAVEMTVDLKLRSGVDVTARVRTFDGQPLGTYYVLGATGRAYPWADHKEDRFTIVGCYPDETRRLLLYQPARNLVASAEVTGVPPEPIEIRLRPGATITGRLLDLNGLPVEGATLAPDGMLLMRAAQGHLAEMKRDRGSVPKLWPYRETDKKGRFEIEGLVPGLKYTAALWFPQRTSRGNGMGLVDLFADVALKSGQTKDLGDVRAKPPERRRKR